jgi:hypothetical protein
MGLMISQSAKNMGITGPKTAAAPAAPTKPKHKKPLKLQIHSSPPSASLSALPAAAESTMKTASVAVASLTIMTGNSLIIPGKLPNTPCQGLLFYFHQPLPIPRSSTSNRRFNHFFYLPSNLLNLSLHLFQNSLNLTSL